jgi:hypothetical protein
MVTGYSGYSFPVSAAFIMVIGMGAGIAWHGRNVTTAFVGLVMGAQAIRFGGIGRKGKRVWRNR